jgi:3-polyprenyl-4-hydroxybenzoate decarboxylase
MFFELSEEQRIIKDSVKRFVEGGITPVQEENEKKGIFRPEIVSEMGNLWQKLDAGRYIGTFHGVVTKDPDTDWINGGTYRQMIHDKNTTTMSVAQGTLEGMPINEDHRICSVSHSALIWDLVEERMTGVNGVNSDASTAYENLIVQIDNTYYGQVHKELRE